MSHGGAPGMRFNSLNYMLPQSVEYRRLKSLHEAAQKDVQGTNQRLQYLKSKIAEMQSEVEGIEANLPGMTNDLSELSDELEASERAEREAAQEVRM